jgi:hypothetical protein
MRVIVLGMSQNITLLNIAVERVAFLHGIQEVTGSNLDLDTSNPQVDHQSFQANDRISPQIRS